MEKDLNKYIQQTFYDSGAKEDNIKRCKRDYKINKCASLQVFLPKDVVMAFKAKVKESGNSQASVIKGFLESYLSI
jgi:hypothetical protein